MNLNPLQELLIEVKLAEASLARATRPALESAGGLERGDTSGLRAVLGRWLVQAGLWLDPGANKGAVRTPEIRQRA
jgi:hypothetical protein